MAVIEWQASYSVGVAELDEQHKRLLKIMNNLSEVKRHHSDPSVFFQTLNELIQYAQNHFATEERYMEKYGFGGLQEHQQAHASFAQEVFALNEAVAQGRQDVCEKILEFVKDWYLSHVLGMDQRYKTFFAEKGIS